ncbi:MAG: STAS domain-containing protein [Capsulimonas sp.]|uniref:STAS domain-containing protein n=1 Tax=Capsulimonas sp. TaxID=2494211 RepID=UPI00326670AC
MQETNVVQHRLGDGRVMRFGIEGDLDLFSAPTVQASIVEAVADTQPDVVIVDLSKVDFIDSAGLALLLHLRKVEAIGGKLRIIVQPYSQPERVFKLSQFHKFMDVQAEE